MSVTLDLNGNATGVNNSITYKDGPDATWASLFSGATVRVTGQSTVSSVTLTGFNANETLRLTSTTVTTGGVTYTFSIHSNGNGSFTVNYTASSGTSTPPEGAWQTALRGLQVEAPANSLPLSPPAETINLSVAGSNLGRPTIGTETITVTCFYAGTMIRTPDGEAAVESLKAGDLVLTADGAAKKINWLGRQTVSTFFADPMRVLPIRIKAGALAENVPARDLLVSPDHALFVDGVLIQAGALVNGLSIVRETHVPRAFTYFHIEIDDHSLILAENAPAETFVDNVERLRFDNWSEFEALYPQGKTVEELPYPRAKAARQVPVYIRVALADRAQKIGAADSAVA
jgi:hypothetical protein